MNFLIVNYSGLPDSLNYFCPDNGLALLAGILEKNDTISNCFVIDYCSTYYIDIVEDSIDNLDNLPDKKTIEEKVRYKIIDEISQFIVEHNVAGIGFKLWTGEGYTGSCLFSKAIKSRFPDIFIIGGGPHVDYFGKYALDNDNAFDCLIASEAEVCINQLIVSKDNKEVWANIPNLIYHHDGVTHENDIVYTSCLESLPPPIYSKNRYITIDGKINFFIIEDSRGCNRQCNFCIEPIKSGKKIRTKSPEKIITEIQLCSNQLKSTSFRFSCSTPSVSHRKSVSKKLLELGVDYQFSSFLNVSDVSPEYISLLKESGCKNIFFGVESFNNHLLKNSFGKLQTNDQIVEALNLTHKNGIHSTIGLIYPAPLETESSENETIESVVETRPNSVFVVFPLISPKTRWGKSPSEFAIEIENKDEFHIKSMTYDPRHTKEDVSAWSVFETITINGLSYFEMSSKIEKSLRYFNKHGIQAQVSIEMPIISESINMVPEQLNRIFHSLITDLKISEIKHLISDINTNL